MGNASTVWREKSNCIKAFSKINFLVHMSKLLLLVLIRLMRAIHSLSCSTFSSFSLLQLQIATVRRACSARQVNVCNVYFSLSCLSFWTHTPLLSLALPLVIWGAKLSHVSGGVLLWEDACRFEKRSIQLAADLLSSSQKWVIPSERCLQKRITKIYIRL